MQSDAVGSVIHFLIGSTSVCKEAISDDMEVHVVPSHFVASNLGKVVDALYAVVHSAPVGSVMQLLIGVISVVATARTFGKVVAALYVVVQSTVLGSVIQFFRGNTSAFSAETSVVNVEHVELSHLEPITAGMLVEAA